MVLAPTRELAVQIGKEAEKLVLMHKKQQRGAFQSLLSSQVVYGGSSKKEDITKFHREGLPTILVATPGRLKDHLCVLYCIVLYCIVLYCTLRVIARKETKIPFLTLKVNGRQA